MNTIPIFIMHLILNYALTIEKYDISLENELLPERNFLENQIWEFREETYQYLDSNNPIVIKSSDQGPLTYELNKFPNPQDFPPQFSIDQDKQRAIIIHSKQRISKMAKFKKDYHYSIYNTVTKYTYVELITCQSNLKFLKEIGSNPQITTSIKSFNRIPRSDKLLSNYYFYDLLSETESRYYLQFLIEQHRETQPQFIMKFQTTNVKIKYQDFVQEIQGVFYQINNQNILLEIPPVISNSKAEYEQIKFVVTLLEKESRCEFNEDDDQIYEVIQMSEINDAQIIIPQPKKRVNLMRVICEITISNVIVTLPIVELEFHFPPPPILSNNNSYLLMFIAILSFGIFVYRLNRAK